MFLCTWSSQFILTFQEDIITYYHSKIIVNTRLMFEEEERKMDMYV